ncbi:hypothetical protein BDQ17DRAFT_1427272 [Cyathus striatus]|nr:hypothetical protein BDQ17DRAFT_1427272 [Cyathus striatus]
MISSRLSELKQAHRALLSSAVSDCAPDAALLDEVMQIEFKLNLMPPAIVEEWQQKMDAIINVVSHRWNNSLKHVMFTTDKQQHLRLRESYFRLLKGCHTLKTFQVEGWSVPSRMSSFLGSVAKGWPAIKFLIFNPSLERKEQVSMSCIRLPTTVRATFSLRHDLRTLVVDSNMAIGDERGKAQIARYLNILFPNLRAVMSPASGDIAETWKEVHDIVKLLQVTRKDDWYRFDIDISNL